MEQQILSSPPSDLKTVSSESKLSPPSNHHDHDYQQFASDFATLYHSIFPPKTTSLFLPNSLSFSVTPSTSSPSSSSASTGAADFHDGDTEHRLHQASLILEYQQLCDHYDLCLSRLQSLSKEMDSLCRENNDLRLVNNELLKLLSISPQAAVHNRRINELNNIVEPNRFDRRIDERVPLPKSISVRSSGYLKMNRASASSSTRPRIASRHNLDQIISRPVQQRVCVGAGGGGGGGNNNTKREEEAGGGVEMEVYNQGMWKTELCNKWQETGTCPYGEHCQFAHGIMELRPVIRHPRYKTQVCRMVVAGEVCPYGHRCHFRHSITDHDRLLLGPR